MSKKKKVLAVALVLLALVVNVLVLFAPHRSKEDTVTLNINLQSEKAKEYQLFYLVQGQKLSSGFGENQSIRVWYAEGGKKDTLRFVLPKNITHIRLDFGDIEDDTAVSDVSFKHGFFTEKLDNGELLDTKKKQAVSLTEIDEATIGVEASYGDPYVVWNVEGHNLEEMVEKAERFNDYGFRILFLLFMDAGLLFVITHFNRAVSLPKELYQNRKLVINLAKNDFKTKFAGSFFGTFWAFVQPVITVLVYWFVFEKGLKAGGQLTAAGIEVPFVLWLIAGLVPWFFFSDALGSGTNAMMEYSYLVKKVVFKISILPIVKVISSLFVHLFFIAFTVVLYAAYRYYPDLYTVQIFYYSFALFIFTLALVYGTCAIVIFFKDLTQIINIILQVGVWVTPIMWNIDTMQLNPVLIKIFKLNPLYYIVAGYRDALINKVWFFERPGLTLYFWAVTLLLLLIGTTIFKRLRVHFADVL